MSQIQYGRIVRKGKLVGYATFEEQGRKIEIINDPGMLRLQVLIDGKENGQWDNCPKGFDMTVAVMIWTKVAGWLGMADLARSMGA